MMTLMLLGAMVPIHLFELGAPRETGGLEA